MNSQDKIKEKIKIGCGEYFDNWKCCGEYKNKNNLQEQTIKHRTTFYSEICLCPICQAKKETLAEVEKAIDTFEKELLLIVDDCVNSWSYVEGEYHKKFKEFKQKLGLGEVQK